MTNKTQTNLEAYRYGTYRKGLDFLEGLFPFERVRNGYVISEALSLAYDENLNLWLSSSQWRIEPFEIIDIRNLPEIITKLLEIIKEFELSYYDLMTKCEKIQDKVKVYLNIKELI